MKLFHKWHDQSHGCPISRQTSRMTCQPIIMHDWWHNLAWLVARSCMTCLWPLAICNRRSSVLNMTINLAVTKFACTIFRINLTISYIGHNIVASPVWLGLYGVSCQCYYPLEIYLYSKCLLSMENTTYIRPMNGCYWERVEMFVAMR